MTASICVKCVKALVYICRYIYAIVTSYPMTRIKENKNTKTPRQSVPAIDRCSLSAPSQNRSLTLIYDSKLYLHHTVRPQSTVHFSSPFNIFGVNIFAGQYLLQSPIWTRSAVPRLQVLLPQTWHDTGSVLVVKHCIAQT